MDSRRIEQVFGNERIATAAARSPDTRGRADNRLQTILAAATRVMAQVGYQRASMRTIAQEADVSLAGLYHYVTGKEQLLFMIQFRAFSALLTEVQSHLFGVEDPIEQLRIMIRIHVQYIADNMAALKVCSHELDSLSGDAYDQVRRIRREYYELGRALIARIIHDRAPNAGLDHRVATMCLFGSLNWLYRWYDPAGERSPTSLANQIFTQFLGGIVGAGGPARRPGSGNGHGPTATRPASPADASGRT